MIDDHVILLFFQFKQLMIINLMLSLLYLSTGYICHPCGFSVHSANKLNIGHQNNLSQRSIYSPPTNIRMARIQQKPSGEEKLLLKSCEILQSRDFFSVEQKAEEEQEMTYMSLKGFEIFSHINAFHVQVHQPSATFAESSAAKAQTSLQ